MNEPETPEREEADENRGILARALQIVSLPMAWFDAWERRRARRLVMHDMVGWYDPVQLVRTGADVLVSTALGSRLDFRLLEALKTAEPPFTPKPDPDGGIVLDYVADVGDGWNPTYAIAQLLARESIDVDDGGKKVSLPRGRVLILGGDAVYPTASKKAYEERFVVPYEHASRDHEAGEAPWMFAIPGNHDWYDGLVSFTRLFCQGKRIGLWQTKQQGSYFALALPHGFWLLAVDVQLESDIDFAQLDFFRRVVDERMQKGDRVIVCTAEPDWVHAARYDPKIADNLVALDEVVGKKARIVARIAGDLHHYRRHEGKDGVQYVTSGGGGAFLHPTFPPLNTIHYGDKVLHRVRKSTYPSAARSWLLTWANLGFVLWNWRLGFVTAFVYALVAAVMPPPVASRSLGAVLEGALEATVTRPAAFVLVSLVVLAFIAFTDTHRKPYRVIGGAVHASWHLGGALAIAWLAHRVLVETCSLPEGLGTTLAAETIGGFVLGPTLFGLYLAVSLAVFRRHANEAFSGLRVAGYKNFLRLRIDPDGELTVWAVKLDRVPRCRVSQGRIVQDAEPRAELIERFVVGRRPRP